MSSFLLCSNCFKNEGLRIYSDLVGVKEHGKCPNCKGRKGKKLNIELLNHIVYMFFVRGTLHKVKYGAAPIIQFNDKRECEIKFDGSLGKDVKLLENNMKLGLFYYDPRLWMIGEIEPLKKLLNKKKRKSIFKRLIKEYPTVNLEKKSKMYRVRINPQKPQELSQYDSPPKEFLNSGRFDSNKLPILYASLDIEVCIHECRVTVEDSLYLSTLKTNRKLKLLDLTEILYEDKTEFESLDISMHFLFYAGKYSYDISRDMAQYIHEKGYDGIIYPSYFSSIKNGNEPFETVYGLSIRRFENLREHIKNQTSTNIALFGRPIKEKKLKVSDINKLILNKVNYDYSFGPISF